MKENIENKKDIEEQEENKQTKKRNTNKKSEQKNIENNNRTKKTKHQNEIDEHFEKIEKEIKTKKQLPKDVEEKINKKVFENVLIADAVMLFLYFISLGSLNIESAIFVTDLKVFSVALIIITIILFEYSYKKEKGSICIHGIECFILAIFMLLSTYLYTIYFKNFHMIVASVSFLFAIYYVGKSIIIYRRMKKEYINSLNDINEIIKK